MKNLLLTLTLTPLLTFAAKPAKIYGPQELCYSRKGAPTLTNGERFATIWSNHFLRAPMRFETQCNATYAEIYRRFFDALVEDSNDTGYRHRAYCGDNGMTITEIIKYYAFTTDLTIMKPPNVLFDDKVCDAIKNSLILKLKIELAPKDTTTLDAQSIERLRTAWATPTDIFPNGRNPKNLILPKAPAPTAAAGSTDNKDHKS